MGSDGNHESTPCESAVARVLKQCLATMQEANHRLSLRAFAAKAQVSHSALSEVLSGKRRLSRAKAERIAEALKMSPEMRAEFLSDFESTDLSSHPVEKVSRHVLEEDQFNLIARWYHLAILSLAETQGFVYEAEWIAERLGITAEQAKSALSTLERLELLLLDENGCPCLMHRRVATSDEILNAAIQHNHFESLAQAQVKLMSASVDERYVTSMTIAMNSRQLSRIKDLIRQLLDEVDRTANQDSTKTDVFKLNVQFFGLT